MSHANAAHASPQPVQETELEHVVCNLCGADDPDVIYEAQPRQSRSRDLVHTFRASGDELLTDRLVRCRRCGLQYVSPRLRGAVIVEAYALGEDPTYVSQVQARERTFGDALARIETLHPTRGRLLDIGTAAGAFLAAARARGWTVEGCEPNRWMAEWGSRHYGIAIRPGDLFAQTFSPASFDVITLWDVIEHTPDPARVIGQVRQLLRPDGLLVVNYPDIGSSIARLLGRKWPFLSSVHLYYYTRATMTRFLAQHGLEIVEMRPHVQRLELDYLLARGNVVSDLLSKSSRAIARALGLSRRQVPYWLGQTFVAARPARQNAG
jgi:2-polyprenyl-3-methyl-5-hydroxy-6-metoxy-1,4-benzoquinol methylase